MLRFTQSSIGRPQRFRFAVESTRPGCERAACIDTAPAGGAHAHVPPALGRRARRPGGAASRAQDATNSRKLVLNADMTRQRVLSSSAVLAAFAALALPAAAPAKITELGQLPDGILGVCPLDCQAVSRTTGYQAKVGPGPRALPGARRRADRRLDASRSATPGPKQTAFFAERLGGESQAAIVVLATEKKLVRRVVAKAPAAEAHRLLRPGRAVPARADAADQEGPVRRAVGALVGARAAARRSARTRRGARAARRTPATTRRRSSRSSATRRAAPFGCLYKTARLTYSATFIPTPTASKPLQAASPGAAGAPPARRLSRRRGSRAQKLSNSPPPACAPPVVD